MKLKNNLYNYDKTLTKMSDTERENRIYTLTLFLKFDFEID